MVVVSANPGPPLPDVLTLFLAPTLSPLSLCWASAAAAAAKVVMVTLTVTSPTAPFQHLLLLRPSFLRLKHQLLILTLLVSFIIFLLLCVGRRRR